MPHQIVEYIAPAAPEKTLKLGETKPGDLVRYANVPFDKAIDGDAFWLIVADETTKDGRKRLLSVKDFTTTITRDPEHLVVVHGFELRVKRQPN